MKKIVAVALVTVSLVIGLSTFSYASDWDKAGKVFAIIEGVRVFTGGKVDVIGSITGINNPRQEVRDCSYSGKPGHDKRILSGGRKDRYEKYERVWVPHYVWKKRYIPKHTEHRPGYGEVVVEGHYERYQVQEGGHWEYRKVCESRNHYSRR